jgi:hypothetical protein
VGEVRGSDEAVVAAADHDHVVAREVRSVAGHRSTTYRGVGPVACRCGTSSP